METKILKGGLDEFLDTTGSKFYDLMEDKKATAEEKAFYLGNLNMIAAIKSGIMKGVVAMTVNYETAKKMYEEANEKCAPIVKDTKALKKLRRLLEEIFEDDDEDEEIEEQPKDSKKKSKKE